MKVRYESEDGKVSGYGDDGKAAVEAYEADPLARFAFPWHIHERGEHILNKRGAFPPAMDYRDIALLGSRLAPLVQSFIREADTYFDIGWRERDTQNWAKEGLKRLEAAMNETLNA